MVLAGPAAPRPASAAGRGTAAAGRGTAAAGRESAAALLGRARPEAARPEAARPETARPGRSRRGAAAAAGRRGRPPGTSRRQLELIALRLFTSQGFDQTPIEQIAAQAGVSRRTFFRYFDSKTGVLWGEFDAEVEHIRTALAAVPANVPMMDAIRRAVVAANHYRAEDIPELRARMNLIISVPSLQSSAAVRYDAWERAISDFAAARTGQPAGALYPLAVGRATLAACRAAYDRWCARGDADLTVYLDAALAALAAGFQPAVLGPEDQVLAERLPGTGLAAER